MCFAFKLSKDLFADFVFGLTAPRFFAVGTDWGKFASNRSADLCTYRFAHALSPVPHVAVARMPRSIPLIVENLAIRRNAACDLAVQKEKQAKSSCWISVQCVFQSNHEIDVFQLYFQDVANVKSIPTGYRFIPCLHTCIRSPKIKNGIYILAILPDGIRHFGQTGIVFLEKRDSIQRSSVSLRLHREPWVFDWLRAKQFRKWLLANVAAATPQLEIPLTFYREACALVSAALASMLWRACALSAKRLVHKPRIRRRLLPEQILMFRRFRVCSYVSKLSGDSVTSFRDFGNRCTSLYFFAKDGSLRGYIHIFQRLRIETTSDCSGNGDSTCMSCLKFWTVTLVRTECWSVSCTHAIFQNMLLLHSQSNCFDMWKTLENLWNRANRAQISKRSFVFLYQDTFIDFLGRLVA